MAKQVSEDLKDFYGWLQVSQYVQKRTATVYCSLVRSILRDVTESPTPELLDRFFSRLEDQVKRATHRTAWKKYALWIKEKQGYILPDAPAPIKTVKIPTKEATDIPFDVVAALYFCIRRCGVRLSDMERMVWGCVFKTRVPHRTFVKLSPDDKRSYALPDRCIEVLKEYANPQNEYTPLIPRSPGSQFPYPLPGLKKALVIYEKAWLESEQQGQVLPGVFNPYIECQSFHFPQKTEEFVEPPLPEDVIKPPPPDLDVPLERSITTADLLARLSHPVTQRPFSLDFSELDYRVDEPGDWRFLYGWDD